MCFNTNLLNFVFKSKVLGTNKVLNKKDLNKMQ